MLETLHTLSSLRDDIIGNDLAFTTPFGVRHLVYADYTASARCFGPIEAVLADIQQTYANTHTEDDFTGRQTSDLLYTAENLIKTSVNAGEGGRIVACGTGATGAIDKLQQILGVAVAPATRFWLEKTVLQALSPNLRRMVLSEIEDQRPVVFIGPYEHHSNEVSWRQGFCQVVQIELSTEGQLDLAHLEQELQRPEYQNRLRIGSFSAASNVTGIRTDVRRVAALLHKYNALACIDYAACGPYVEIDMNPEPQPGIDECYLDAIYLAPHKFLGGPGSCGVLVLSESIYRQDLPPTVGGGGTVSYVGPTAHDFYADTEDRERAGTPGILQIVKAALAFQLKDRLNVKRIEAREQELLNRAFERLKENGNIEILGNEDPMLRIGIISFNIKDPQGGYLHPKLVTRLLNDLFGIQSRAGCSCAGPYGHRLLDIGDELSQKYRHWVSKGFEGIKPGWCRVSLHYGHDDLEADYLIDAIDFLGTYGTHFLPLYDFDFSSGLWTYRSESSPVTDVTLNRLIGEGDAASKRKLTRPERDKCYRAYLREAEEIAESMGEETNRFRAPLDPELEELIFFSLAHSPVMHTTGS